ncbi:MAG: helix-turn-helix domain-containing protein [Phycisphaeraceae bacterium]
MLPAQPNQSLIDGLTVLQAVVSRTGEVGTRELARELEIEPTRINRLLKTLAHLGLAEQTAGRKYRPGPAIHVLAAQSLFGSGLLRRAIPHLEALHTHGLVVALGVLWRDQVCYLYHAAPGMSAGEALGRVGLFPATRSGIGMALLAQGADLRRFGRELQTQLRRVREQGYALVVRHDKPRGRSLGVALPGDVSAAIALSGPIIDRRVPELAAALHAAAHAITGARHHA